MTTNRKRVVIIAMNYAPEITGCGRYTGDLAQELAARGYSVSVITTPPHYPGWTIGGSARNRYSVEALDGVVVHRCPLFLRKAMRGVWRLVAPASFAISAAPITLWRILKDRPHLVLVVEPTLFVAPVALLAAMLVRARTALHVQDLEVDAAFAVGHLSRSGILVRLAKAFESVCLQSFDEIITISRRMAEKIADKNVDRTRIGVIRNWVDVDHIRPIAASHDYRAELSLPTDRVLVLYSGSFGPKQGLDIVISAARRLKENRKVHFAICGEGPEKPALERLAADLDNVTFLPFQPYARLGEFLGLADIHVLPQQANTVDLMLPSKLGGMLASGRPIVVTADKRAELALFLEGCVAVAEPGDPAALAGAIEKLASGHSDSDGLRQRLELARQLSRQTALDRFEQLLLDDTRVPGGYEVPSAGDSGVGLIR